MQQALRPTPCRAATAIYSLVLNALVLVASWADVDLTEVTSEGGGIVFICPLREAVKLN